jgi:CBS domain containing-hemolysin-like protein
MPSYQIIDSKLLNADITYRKPRQLFNSSITLDDPAIEVMTDFTTVTAISVNPCASLDNARDRMIASKIHMLFVTNQFHEVVGLITSNDLSGEKAMQHVSETGGKMADVMVRDIMTPKSLLEAITMQDLRKASVGDLVETFKRMGRQHALAIEPAEGDDTKPIIRGILSVTQINKQLGRPITESLIASSIADLAAEA